jgi:HK97 family phage major capsid protein
MINKTITEMNDEIRVLMQQLTDMRNRCLDEKREPSGEERRIAEEVLNRVEELEAHRDLAMREQELRDRLEQSVRAPTKPELNPETQAQKERDSFKSFGEQLMAVYHACAPGGVADARLRKTFRGAATGLGEATPSDGGFLVQQEFVADLIMRAYETGQVASRCQRIPIGENANGLKMPGIDETSRVDGSRWGGVRIYWLSEGTDKTATKPKFREIELTLKKVAGLCYTTDELLMDSTALEAYIRQAFSEEFGFTLDDACINGTGAGQPLGIMNSACLVTAGAETGQLAATVVYENIVNMWARMWAKSRGNAVWFINQDVEPQLFNMGITIGTGGSPVYLPPGGASATPYGTLFGRPVIPIEQCQTLGTVGDIILADMSQYLMIDKGPIQAATSIHVRFIYDETAFRFVYRVDGQPMWNSALTPFKGTNTLSPFVVLATRS